MRSGSFLKFSFLAKVFAEIRLSKDKSSAKPAKLNLLTNRAERWAYSAPISKKGERVRRRAWKLVTIFSVTKFLDLRIVTNWSKLGKLGERIDLSLYLRKAISPCWLSNVWAGAMLVMAMKVAVIIPTYNEKDNIMLVIDKILKLRMKKLVVVVVDDNSPDGTGKVVDALTVRHRGKVAVIHRRGKLGLGTAFVEGWTWALKNGAEAVFGMDGDGSHDPKELPGMIEKLNKVDAVIGSRHIKDGKVVGFAWWRTALTRSAQFFCRVVLALPVYDSTSSYRGYRKEVIKAIDIATIRSSGYSFLIEVLDRVVRSGFSVAEVPIEFGVRKGGESKVSSGEIYKALGTVIRLMIRPYRF